MSGFEVLAIILFAFGGFFRNPRLTIALYTLSNFLFLFVYFELGLFMVCISIMLSSIRGIAALILNEQRNRYSVAIFTFAIVVLIAIEINNYADLLIICAAIAIGLAAYFRDKLVLYWTATITSQILWITHSLIFEVYGMLICCCVIMTTGIFAICRHIDLPQLLRAMRQKPALSKQRI